MPYHFLCLYLVESDCIFTLSDEHGVDVCSDTISNHLLLTGNNVAIIHNHPSTQTLSIEDIGFFLDMLA